MSFSNKSSVDQANRIIGLISGKLTRGQLKELLDAFAVDQKDKINVEITPKDFINQPCTEIIVRFKAVSKEFNYQMLDTVADFTEKL